MPAPHGPQSKPLVSIRKLVYLGLMILLLYIVAPRLPGFLLGWQEIRQIQPLWVLISAACFCSSILCSAGVYRVLSGGRMPYLKTFVVQVAATFLDRLLPAGSGAFGVSYLYARKQQFDNAQAIAIVATNNILGFAGHLLLLLIGVILFGSKTQLAPRLHIDPLEGILIVFTVVILALAIVLVFPKLREPVRRNGLEVIQTVLQFGREPYKLLGGLAFSIAMTLGFSASLYAAALAVGVTISPFQAFIVSTAGVAASVFIPTPGGLGSAEAGIAATLIGFGVTARSALEIALLFRFVTFWLPILFGAVAFAVLDRKGIIDPSVVRNR